VLPGGGGELVEIHMHRLGLFRQKWLLALVLILLGHDDDKVDSMLLHKSMSLWLYLLSSWS
jgi:hypothetical protein